MKRLVLLLLAFSIVLLTGVCYAEISNIQIEVNGVNVIFVENDRVLHAIEEDGVVYVPIGAFLDAINIPYEQNGDKIILNISNQAVVESSKAEKQDSTDYFAQLPKEGQVMINGLIVWANVNTIPSSLKINKVCIDEIMHRYLLYITYDKGLERNQYDRIYVNSYGETSDVPDWTQDELKKADFDIRVLNNAYLQKCDDPAYSKLIFDMEGRKAIDKQILKIDSAETLLKRWIDGGKKSESDIAKQREKVKKEKEKLEELRKQYGIYD